MGDSEPRILEIDESDLDTCADYLLINAAERFVNGGYTHVRCDGCVTEAQSIKGQGFPLVSIGKDVTDEVY